VKSIRSNAAVLASCLAVLALSACSRYSLDEVPRPDLDLAAPAPDGASLERNELNRNATSMVELIQGRLPGVDVRTDARGRLTVQIRGRTSVTDESALIVVDGVESTTSALLAMNPQNVERIEVLKDGSAAIYGVRGANGVLLITTRRWQS
jgi:TonB-dependent SusC/RagA subfamily outer membrane receptor